jgi:hypothetical protein
MITTTSINEIAVAMRGNANKNSPLFEIARVLVRLDHVVSFIINANHSMM